MNWLDTLVLVGIVFYVVTGILQGFTRTAIGFCAAWAGVLGGFWLYRSMGFWMRPLVPSKPLANALGFALIFSLAAVGGLLLERLRKRYYPAGSTLWFDRLLGGAFGLVQGGLTAAIFILVMLAFWPRAMEWPLRDSRSAPYLMRAAHVLAQAAPDEIRDGFRAARRDLETAPLPGPVRQGLARLE
ncbi:MAG TPA: CvpA family protein [Bryobacteraceae bacterium]|nr:CvpA family protein [Bryobacteraceae bacterium]